MLNTKLLMKLEFAEKVAVQRMGKHVGWIGFCLFVCLCFNSTCVLMCFCVCVFACFHLHWVSFLFANFSNNCQAALIGSC